MFLSDQIFISFDFYAHLLFFVLRQRITQNTAEIGELKGCWIKQAIEKSTVLAAGPACILR